MSTWTRGGAPAAAPAEGTGSHLDVPGGRIAYESRGEGPLIVLSPGIGDLRQSYRFLAPRLVAAGYRVVSADLRGHGDSSTGWSSISRSDVAGDLVALVRRLGAPAVVVGQSLSGGAATVAAAQAPELIRAIVELNPFTRVPRTDVRALATVPAYRRGALLMAATAGLRSLPMWLRYLDAAYPTKPADWAVYRAAIRAKLSEPGRMQQFLKTIATSGADAQAALPLVTRPALIVMGTADPDFPDPRAEGEAVVAALPAGVGSLRLVEGGGHYIHAERPDEVAAAIVGFLAERVDA
ncbi:alpha/beta fold hydrolase [Amnibacterium kyonggiense]